MHVNPGTKNVTDPREINVVKSWIIIYSLNVMPNLAIAEHSIWIKKTQNRFAGLRKTKIYQKRNYMPSRSPLSTPTSSPTRLWRRLGCFPQCKVITTWLLPFNNGWHLEWLKLPIFVSFAICVQVEVNRSITCFICKILMKQPLNKWDNLGYEISNFS